MKQSLLSLGVMLALPLCGLSQLAQKKPVAGASARLAPVPPNPPPKQDWSSEPTSFFGLKLGSPIAASLPECQREAGDHIVPIYKWSADGPECYEMSVPLYRITHVSMFYPVYADETENRVSFIQSPIKAAYLERDYDALVLKFGKPTSEVVSAVRSNAGVEYQNRVSTWIGKDVRLTLQTVGSRVDEGLLTLTTQAFRKAEAIKRGSDTKAAADSF